MSWSKELVILSSYSLIYANLKKLQNCRNFQVNCSSSHHLWTKKDVLSKGYSVPDAQLFVPWPFLIFLSISSWLIHHQQFRGAGDAEYCKLSVWVCENPLRLTALHTIQEKEIPTHRKDPAGLSLVLLFSALADYRGQGLDYRDCLDECVQLVTGLVKVVKSGRGSANLQQRLVFLSLEETPFVYSSSCSEKFR